MFKTTPLSTSSVIAHCAQLRNKIYSFKIRHFQHSILAKICVTLSIHYSLIVSSIHCTANICFNRNCFNLSLDLYVQPKFDSEEYVRVTASST